MGVRSQHQASVHYLHELTMLNWKPSNASVKVDLPSDCMPITTNSGVARSKSNSMAIERSSANMSARREPMCSVRHWDQADTQEPTKRHINMSEGTEKAKEGETHTRQGDPFRSVALSGGLPRWDRTRTVHRQSGETHTATKNTCTQLSSVCVHCRGSAVLRATAPRCEMRCAVPRVARRLCV
jgi:hypothetical protein